MTAQSTPAPLFSPPPIPIADRKIVKAIPPPSNAISLDDPNDTHEQDNNDDDDDDVEKESKRIIGKPDPSVERKQEMEEKRKHQTLEVTLSKRQDQKLEYTNKKRMATKEADPAPVSEESPCGDPEVVKKNSAFSVESQFPEHKRTVNETSFPDREQKRAKRDTDGENPDEGKKSWGWILQVAVPVAVIVTAMVVSRFNMRKR